jgi:hypothetical protein
MIIGCGVIGCCLAQGPQGSEQPHGTSNIGDPLNPIYAVFIAIYLKLELLVRLEFSMIHEYEFH